MWAKRAATLPLPDNDPTYVSHIVIGGGYAPIPAPMLASEVFSSARSAPDDLVSPKRHA